MPLKNEDISQARGMSGPSTEGDQGPEVGGKWAGGPEGAPEKDGVVEKRRGQGAELVVSEDKRPFDWGCCLSQAPTPELWAST